MIAAAAEKGKKLFQGVSQLAGLPYVGNVRGNPPFFARNNICCGTATTWFGTPFAGGVIEYAVGSSKSPTSFPLNAKLANGMKLLSNFVTRCAA